jgi:hypothetical protein
MCTADASDLRDWKTIQARTEQEGMSFLTITLPSFAKSFERSLASGFVDPADFPGFRKSGAIPAFLQGMLGRLFSRESGRIFDHVPDHSILVDAVRQVCLLFKKVEMRCTPERENAAISNFLEVERANHAFILDPAARDSFLGVAKCLWPSVLGDLSPDMLVPRHGPGATAERVLGNQKFVWQRWHERLEVLTPFFGFAYSIGAAGEQRGQKAPQPRTGQVKHASRTTRPQRVGLSISFQPPHNSVAEQPAQITLTLLVCQPAQPQAP